MYPPIEPFTTGFLKVSDAHNIYYEVSGNRDGKPVVFLHGGPGGGVSEKDRLYFDPTVYKIVLFDQRGAGKSTPSALVEENTTWDLVKDIDTLKQHLGISTQWVVFGGSWGSTLALAYAQTYPKDVKALILRGIFTLRRSELEFFYQNGTSHLFPEEWDSYISIIPESERSDMIKAYHSRLFSEDAKVRLEAARVWSRWEMATSRLEVSADDIARAEKDDWSNAFARIENHYFVNGGFMKEGQLLEKQSIDKIRHIPCIVVQGRYDVVCPATTAYALKKEWPEIELHLTLAGHSAREEANAALLVEAADKFKTL